MRRGAVFLAAAAAAVVALIGVAPAMFQPTGHRLAMTEKPSDYGLPDMPVTFSPRDRPITLRAWWIPAATAARGALVFVHGGGDDNRNLPYGSGLALARDLAAAGYALLMVDLRNFGESEGTAEGITFGDLEVHDVVGAVDYLAVQAAGVPVGAIGFSMGGATVLRAAARDRRLRAIVADSAFADARGVAVAFTTAATGLPRLIAAPFVWSAQHLHGVPLGRGDTVAALRGATMPPVLLIHDAHDPISPVDDCRRLAAAIPNASTWITELENPGAFGTHIQGYRLAPQAYVARVTEFLDRALRGEAVVSADRG
jgi:pimeloyl-ACP methyl ester carboxylesterase